MNYWSKHIHTTTQNSFAAITILAQQYNAIDLGQGVTDFDPPPHFLDALMQAVSLDIHHYSPYNGEQKLREAIAKHSQYFYNLNWNPETNILVTNGATEAIYAAIMCLVDPGDEVIVFEPFYYSYAATLAMAGAEIKYVSLHPPTWQFIPEELERSFSAKTKLLLLNTPHNPTGKVFSLAELILIAELCEKYDVLVVTDEVYEHTTFNHHQHIRLATLPKMQARTLTISNLGKTFNTTGWKIGWAIGDENLITALANFCQYTSFSVSSILQYAAGCALLSDLDYYTKVRTIFADHYHILFSGLQNHPWITPYESGGTYFLTADISQLALDSEVPFAEFLAKQMGVACIPLDSFYRQETLESKKIVRFNFGKSETTLHKALDRLNRPVASVPAT